MTPQDRAALAEQLLSNPLFVLLLEEQESSAVEAMIWTDNDELRARAAMRVQAIRSLGGDCRQAIADSERTPRAAPA